MKIYNEIYEKWWVKYLFFPLLVGVILILLGLIAGPGISIDNRESVSSPILVESPNSTVNYLEGKDSLLREYAYVASMFPEGSSMRVGRGLTNNSELLSGTYKKTDGKLYFECDNNSLNKYEQVIETEPKFPFSYFALAVCKKESNASEWVDYAEKAIKIFEVTTQIGGHKKEHDEALQILLKMKRE